MSDQTEFKLLRFNPRRASRCVGAAEVECTIDGMTDVLWMTRRDIQANIHELGDCEELQKALKAYRDNVDFPAGEFTVPARSEP